MNKLLNKICEALGLFDGARPTSPQHVFETEILPAIEALKMNSPEAAILVEENRRVNRLWQDAISHLARARRRADGFLERYNTCEQERRSRAEAVVNLQASLKASDTRLAAAVEVLRTIEFNGGTRGDTCPMCDGWDADPARGATPGKHAKNCALRALLDNAAFRAAAEEVLDEVMNGKGDPNNPPKGLINQ